jgi:hypothetical protein
MVEDVFLIYNNKDKLIRYYDNKLLIINNKQIESRVSKILLLVGWLAGCIIVFFYEVT